MSALLAIPLEVRLAVLFVLGTAAGSLANLAIYRLAWNPRRISPWSPPEPEAPPRRWTDRVPVLGWLGLRREVPLHGCGFWVRPMLLEIVTGGLFAWLYWWEVGQLRLLPAFIPHEQAPQVLLHVQFVCHVALIWLMLAASMIDADEKIIPDTITVPGTLLGLLLAAAYPWSLPVVIDVQLVAGGDELPHLAFLHVLSPFWSGHWPDLLRAWPHAVGLAAGLGCWWLWCVGLMPRTWYTRRGYCRALALSWARLRREKATRSILILGVIGSLPIVGVWLLGGQGAWGAPNGIYLRWVGLLSALVGMAAAGMLVWMVRVIGTNVMGREAMGFGDVTLMAMIGTFMGWQPCLLIFLLAPFFALGVGILNVVLHSEHEIPYGPFLCLAALTVLVFWPQFWDAVDEYFLLGPLIPLIVLVCMGLMAVMLAAMRLLRSLWG